MKTLSESTIEALAGSKTYQRGLDYYNEGRVGRLDIQGTRIFAQVRGEQNYQVELQHTQKVFEGSCSCPASDHFDFCKHGVAAALSYYYQTQTNQEIADSSYHDLVGEYLSTLTKPQLVDELQKLIKRDQSIHDQWLLKAEVSSGRLGAKDLRKRITKAIVYKPSGLWRYQAVSRYFNDAHANLLALKEPILSLDSHSAIKLIIYAIERLEKTLETIDDSGGYRIPLEISLEEWFKQTLANQDWDLKTKTTVLTTLINSNTFDYDLLGLPSSLINEQDPALVSAVYQSLTQQWQTLSPPASPNSSNAKLYQRLERALIEQAIHENNIDKELDILSKSATDVKQCIRLIKRCLEHHRLDTANEWLVYVNRTDTLTPHEVIALENIQVSLWLAEKNYAKALDAQWAFFEEDEQAESFQTVLATAEQLDQRQSYLNKGIHYLNERLSKSEKNKRDDQRAEVLTQIYLNNGMAPRAIGLAKQFNLRPGTLMAIVRTLSKLEPSSARIMEAAVNTLASFNANDTNQRALNFLTTISDKVQSRGDAEQQQLFNHSVMNIYQQNKRKTNFIKQLKQTFVFLSSR